MEAYCITVYLTSGLEVDGTDCVVESDLESVFDSIVLEKMANPESLSPSGSFT